ncbi:hypothetical protein DXG01_015238, partial [Tephrocybe rancida]
ATRRHAHLPPARRHRTGGAHTRPPPAPHCPSSAGGGATTRRHAPPARRRGASGAHTCPPPTPHCPSSAGGMV